MFFSFFRMDRVNGRRDTPVNQVRHTNVATLRLDKAGMHFEIACYRNKVISWRNKAETDIGEVLQVDQIFTNVAQGKVASKEKVMKAFESTDPRVAIKYLLDHGELQVSEQEREALQENMFRDVAAIVVEKAINPENNRPYTITMIQAAMRDIHYSVQTTKGAKSQALDVIRRLKAVMPIARAKMRVRMEFPSTSEAEVCAAIEKEMDVKVVTAAAAAVAVAAAAPAGGSATAGSGASSVVGTVFRISSSSSAAGAAAAAAGDTPTAPSGDPSSPNTQLQEQADVGVSSLELLVDPEAYRTLQEIMTRVCGLRGFVQVLQMNASAGADVVADPAAAKRQQGASSGAGAGAGVKAGAGAGAEADLEAQLDRLGEELERSRVTTTTTTTAAAAAAKTAKQGSAGVGAGAVSETGAQSASSSASASSNFAEKASKRDKQAAKEAKAEREAQAALLKGRLERDMARRGGGAAGGAGGAGGREVAAEETAAAPTAAAAAATAESGASSSAAPAPAAASAAADGAAKGKPCNTCGGSFDAAGYRDHFRSEWHRFNLKIKLKNKKALDEVTFLSLSVEQLALMDA